MELPIFIYILISQISLWISVSHVFFEFNRVASWNKNKSIIKVRSSIQISEFVLLVSYSRSKYLNVNTSFLILKFEGNFSTYLFGKSFWHYRNLKLNVGHRYIYYAKKLLKFFLCVETRILVKKWNMYEAHIFPRPLRQTCRLETTSLCLNTWLRVKKFSKFSLFLLKLL